MITTFLVKLDIDITSPDTVTNAADDIYEACVADGLSIIDCVPWDRPTLLSSPPEDSLLSGTNMLSPGL